MSCEVCKCLNLVTYKNGGLYDVFYKVKNTIYEIHPYNITILQYGLLQFFVCFYLNHMRFSRHLTVICKSDFKKKVFYKFYNVVKPIFDQVWIFFSPKLWFSFTKIQGKT